MCISEVSTFTLLCNHHLRPSSEIVLSSQIETLIPLNSKSPLPTPPPSSEPGWHHPTSVSTNLMPLGTSYKWNQAVFVLIRLASFTQHIVPQFIHAVACVRISTPFLRLNSIPVYRYTSHLVYPFISPWTSGLPPPFGCGNKNILTCGRISLRQQRDTQREKAQSWKSGFLDEGKQPTWRLQFEKIISELFPRMSQDAC